ncbi:hypothetical protein GBAR_LOCUS15831 [Geodia barretti]|uniref:Uncharacterized protein n=1 Tax=Geodia barretti TaxID=519541 RepID=A0AA35SD66_GEOBA|nr:hypothetical protein GBAR_LOCUS15831 [Geodia barretti]
MKGKYRSDSNLLQTRTLPPDSALSLVGSQGSAGREGFVSVGEREREVELLTFSSPRLFQRRGGVVGDINVGSIQRLTEDGEQGVKVVVEEEKGGRQVTETVPADKKPLREVLDYIFIKHDLEVDWDPPTHSFTVVTRNGTRTSPDLDLPSNHFSGCSLEIRPLQRDEEREEREEREEGSSARDERPIFKTLEDCLSYFTTHGLVELPSQRDEEEEEYHLPRVHPLDNIPGSWDDLPIKPELKKSLLRRGSQQRASGS